MNFAVSPHSTGGNIMEKLYRVKEISAIIGEDSMTVYKRIRAGEMKGTKIGKRGIRVTETALKNWLRSIQSTKNKKEVYHV
jgi:excisionase family DNA binding protein